MAGMLQIITYLLGFYLVVKGVEILQIGLASNRPKRTSLIIIGIIMVALCTSAALVFVSMQDQQARSISDRMQH